jgi:phosphatidylserine/phosphatidylglycerophosphate/cardiolipin synthase-like enzyme
MRFRSTGHSGTVVAVCGINTISFGLLPTKAVKKGLLGFAVERLDPAEDEQSFLPGFKVFPSVIPNPAPGQSVSTFDQPVQSFVWDDFTAKPDRAYTYRFHPIKGRPKKLSRRSAPLTIDVRTEPLIDESAEHDVFFNRGVASSQAYQRAFGSKPIDKLDPAKRERALRWLSRDLGTALVRFIDSCAKDERLLGCFYEFHWPPALDALKNAIDRGVDVRIIIDAKVNGTTDKNGKVTPSFPREDNLAAIQAANLPMDRIILRQARPAAIAHNKFMVRLSPDGSPAEVWTGSTNLSQGGVSGQTNVGQWVRNPAVAAKYQQYWELLATDPGNPGADSPAGRAKNRAAVEALSPAVADLRQLPSGTTVLFSPRPTDDVLDSYAALLDAAPHEGCVTLAFGIASQFKDALKDNTAQQAIVFLMLEKQDKPTAGRAFIKINSSNNVYQAWGSFIRDPVYQWAKETNAGLLGLNQHVSFIHSKFMLIDPLGPDPLVITGSANFSTASTTDNDENMILVRGDKRVADIYWTEFNRLFNHYYFRSVLESTSHALASDMQTPGDASLFLAEDDSWQAKYQPGTLRAKRLALFADIS